MSMTDPIADLLTRIRNAAAAQHHDVTIPASKLGAQIARILREQGYIDAYEVHDPAPGRPGQELTITLKYTQARKPVISGLQRVSRPGQRTYVDHAHIPRIRDFRGLNPRAFDGRGNYSMGVREQIIFPEVDYDEVDQVRGLDITITTTAQSDDEAFVLLEALGMPFSKEGRPEAALA